MIVVDTNLLLRYLLADNKNQFQTASNLLIKATSGEEELFIPSLVIFEIFWVLSSHYEMDPKDITDIIKKLLDLTNVSIENRELILQTIDKMEYSNLGFNDNYLISQALQLGATSIATFDRKLQKQFDNQK